MEPCEARWKMQCACPVDQDIQVANLVLSSLDATQLPLGKPQPVSQPTLGKRSMPVERMVPIGPADERHVPATDGLAHLGSVPEAFWQLRGLQKQIAGLPLAPA